MTLRHLLIDGDILVYQKLLQSIMEETLVDDEGEYYTRKVVSHKVVIDGIKEQIQCWLTALEASTYTFAMSCPKNNYRKQLYPEYKLNRIHMKKPLGLDYIKRSVAVAMAAKILPSLEGDDVLGILATHPTWKKNYQKITLSLDKDMKTIPGYYSKDGLEIVHISKEEAKYFHYLQTIAGDSTDNYPGCKGIGAVKAEKILEKKGCSWDTVVNTYKENGFTEEDALLQARLAYILQYPHYNIKEKKVVLWTPEM